MAIALLALVAASAAAGDPPTSARLISSSGGGQLPAPTSLLVEYLGEGSSNGDVVVGTRRPRFSFLPHPEHAHPGNGVAMVSYHIVVVLAGKGGKPAWDSGMVNATAAVGIKCGVELASLTSYSWTASWTADGIIGPSPPASASFTIGPAAADWALGSEWVGSGQNEFRITVATPDAAAARIFVASPGGAVLRSATGAHLGSDPTGLSAWVDFRLSVPYMGFPLVQSTSGDADATEPAEVTVTRVVTLTIGNGFWSGSYKLGSSFWGIPSGEAAVAQILIMGGTISKIEGRRGAVMANDPWEGCLLDCGRPDEAGWGAAKPVPAAGGWRPTGAPMALQVPYARASGRMTQRLPIKALEVTVLSPGADGSKRWSYKFDRNIVGHAAVTLDAVSTTGAGNLTLRHCELLNTTLGESKAFCLALAHLPDQPDIYMLPAGINQVTSTQQLASAAITTSAAGKQQLTPTFTWHGFQYVIVEATTGVSFAAKLDSLEPRWTVPELAETAAITFAGEGAETLEQIQEIVVASQISNLAGFGPTDCPSN